MDKGQPAAPALEDVQRTIRKFIIENYLFGADSPGLLPATSFLESGVIDSTGILELIQFVEATFGVHVADTEMVPENLDSLDNIGRFVTRKMSS